MTIRDQIRNAIISHLSDLDLTDYIYEAISHTDFDDALQDAVDTLVTDCVQDAVSDWLLSQ